MAKALHLQAASEEWFTREEVAEKLKLSMTTVDALIGDKKLGCVRPTSRSVRVTAKQLAEYEARLVEQARRAN